MLNRRLNCDGFHSSDSDGNRVSPHATILFPPIPLSTLAWPYQQGNLPNTMAVIGTTGPSLGRVNESKLITNVYSNPHARFLLQTTNFNFPTRKSKINFCEAW